MNPLSILDKFEKFVIWALITLIGLVVLGSLFEVGRQIIQDMLCLETPLVEIDRLLSILGSLLMVLIGLELLHTVKAYLNENKLHVEMVILVAMVAIARKIIVMDYSSTSWHVLFGMAAVFLALCAGYFTIKYNHK